METGEKSEERKRITPIEACLTLVTTDSADIRNVIHRRMGLVWQRC